jgi:hypothetical protein
MANADHVAILRRGSESWNTWRDENPYIAPNLSRADLSRADLSEAKLLEVKLEDAIATGGRIYGISAWNVNLARATQENLSKAQAMSAKLKANPHDFGGPDMVGVCDHRRTRGVDARSKPAVYGGVRFCLLDSGTVLLHLCARQRRGPK